MSIPPLILLIGGHDPSGGAGLQADIETVCTHGCHAISVVTCLTTQDSHDVHRLHPQAVENFTAQLDTLLADMQPHVVKIGLLGDAGLASVLASRLARLQRPVVLDPVLAAGGGSDLASTELLSVIRGQLLPLTTLLTPNRAEARRLSGIEDPQQAAAALLQAGCEHVLLTGADEAEGGQVRNSLFNAQGRKDYDWPRLPYSYHGSGCTLATACACELGLGKPATEVVDLAQRFAWHALERASHPGGGQHMPNRVCPR